MAGVNQTVNRCFHMNAPFSLSDLYHTHCGDSDLKVGHPHGLLDTLEHFSINCQLMSDTGQGLS